MPLNERDVWILLQIATERFFYWIRHAHYWSKNVCLPNVISHENLCLRMRYTHALNVNDRSYYHVLSNLHGRHVVPYTYYYIQTPVPGH